MKLVVIVALLSLVVGCGKEIGDSCVVSSDCDPNGERQCDISQTDGYCTIQGCDYSTCPEDSACIRFFTGQFDNKECTTNADCTFDELCNLKGRCVPRNAEVRYCMRTCGDDGDCRDGYECRDLAKMREHGGEPVLEPGRAVDESAPNFCAAKP